MSRGFNLNYYKYLISRDIGYELFISLRRKEERSNKNL
jgi:hypothetical protein